ncbi:amino acid permease [Rhodofomes roseus]|uniref:Amino acid permease n=1 Tax=Rhodofomes roseus TaxID=34475 RepID=A0ABQ8KLL3_9APHY|nr:amino acid permease [Rhodofomes roseus]KAH9839004.1 amino acid permease [Rhodofomes roseus]
MAEAKEPYASDAKVIDADSEAYVPELAVGPGLQRRMKNRHIAMISIGGVIGTGLFLGTATGLSEGGPVGLLLGYMTIGSLCYCTMISLGEMAAFLPVPGGHITYAERFVDPAWSFALGWLYWYNWTIVLPAEMSAAAVLIGYWNTAVNPAAWITMCLVIVIFLNMFGAGFYGEAEFIFASIKVVTITGLIILGIVLDLGGGPNHDRIGFRYWKHPGPFNQYHGIQGAKGRFLAWWAVMTQAAFSYIGTEVVAIAGAEAKNPRRNIPKAIRNVYIRILLFYMGGVIVIGLLVPYTDDRLNLPNTTAAASPFVIAIQTAGIRGLPSLINACLLTSAWSAGNSDLYCSSRALYSLAINGNAPQIFSKTNKRGLPWVALTVNALLGCLAYMDVGSGSAKVFGWLANMTAIAGLSSWFAIAVTYLRFRKGLKAQGIDRSTLPYSHWLQPFAAWYAAILCFIVCLFSGWSVFLKDNWSTATFVTNYLPMMIFPVLYIIKRFWSRHHFVRPEDMDFKTGMDEVLASSYDEPPPRNWVERIWSVLM